MIDHKLTQFFVTVVASDGQNHPFLIHREIEAAIRYGWAESTRSRCTRNTCMSHDHIIVYGSPNPDILCVHRVQ